MAKDDWPRNISIKKTKRADRCLTGEECDCCRVTWGTRWKISMGPLLHSCGTTRILLCTECLRKLRDKLDGKKL